MWLQFGALNLEARMNAAALEAGLDSPVTAAAAAAGYAPGLQSPLLLQAEPAAAGQAAGVSQQTPGLLPAAPRAAADGSDAPAAMVPVSALGAAAGTGVIVGAATAGAAAPEQSELFFTANDQQTGATGWAAGPTPQSTAASRPAQAGAAAELPAAAAAAGAAAAASAAIMAAGTADPSRPLLAPASLASPSQAESDVSFAFHKQQPAAAGAAQQQQEASVGAPTPELTGAAAAGAAAAGAIGPMGAGAAIFEDGGALDDYQFDDALPPPGPEDEQLPPAFDWSAKTPEELVGAAASLCACASPLACLIGCPGGWLAGVLNFVGCPSSVKSLPPPAVCPLLSPPGAGDAH